MKTTPWLLVTARTAILAATILVGRTTFFADENSFALPTPGCEVTYKMLESRCNVAFTTHQGAGDIRSEGAISYEACVEIGNWCIARAER